MTNEGIAATTILVVDDSVTDRTLSVGLIRRSHPNWHIIPVAGAREALQEITRRHIDIVVSDLVMPGMDGQEFLQVMSDDHPLIPVVLVTAQGDDRIAAECIALGAVNYVPKRRLAEDLVTVLNEVLQAEEEMLATRRVLQYVVQNRCQFEIDSRLDQIWSLVNFIRERLHAMQKFLPEQVRNMTTAVRESLLNAHFHGNLEVNSRPLELSRTEYVALAAERRQQPEFSDRHVRLCMLLEPGTIRFEISDDGSGFDQSCLSSLTGPPQEDFTNGNGIRRMRFLMDSVCYNDVGNEVTLTSAVTDPSGDQIVESQA